MVDTIRWLHLIAVAFFVGGQLMLAVAVVPVLRNSSDTGALRRIARRFGWGSLLALLVLLVTGAVSATQLGRWQNPILHLKLALFLLAAGLVLWHLRRPDLRALDAGILATSVAVVWLGVLLAHG